MKKTIVFFSFLFLIIVFVPCAHAGEMTVNFDFSSYALFLSIYHTACVYFKSFHSTLSQSGVIPSMTATIVTASFVYSAIQTYIGGGLKDSLKTIRETLFYAIIISIFINSYTILSSVMLEFCVRFPIEVASFFMSLISDGPGSLVQGAVGHAPVDSIQSLFIELDDNFKKIGLFCWKMFPTESLINLPLLFFKLLLVGIIFVVYFMIYYNYFKTMLLSTIMIIVCAILSPFIGLVGMFQKGRPLLASLFKTIFYHWMVIVVNALFIALFISIIGGLVDKFVLITNNNALLADPLYIVLLFLMMFCADALKRVNSFVSQFTEIRGASSGGGGGGLMGAVGGAAMAVASKGLVQKIKGLSSAVRNASGHSFKDQQKKRSGI